jgi:hypothetical protein
MKSLLKAKHYEKFVESICLKVGRAEEIGELKKDLRKLKKSMKKFVGHSGVTNSDVFEDSPAGEKLAEHDRRLSAVEDSPISLQDQSTHEQQTFLTGTRSCKCEISP